MNRRHHLLRAGTGLRLSVLVAACGCGGDVLCDSNGERPGVIAVVQFGLFDARGIRICPSPEAEPTYRVGRDDVEPTTERGVSRQGYHARLTPDELSYDILEGGPCNLTLGIYVDGAGRFDYPVCPDAADLHYTIDVPGCVPQTGVFTRDRFEHPAATAWEYRIPVLLDCDDSVARWPEGAPRPTF